MSYYQTVQVPDRGVNSSRKGHSIPPRQWTKMMQMRARIGAVSNFPGWASILSGAAPGTAGCLLTEFRKFDGSAYLMVASQSNLFTYDHVAQILTDVTGSTFIAGSVDNPFVACAFGDTMYMTNLQSFLVKINLTTVPTLAPIGDVDAPALRAPGGRAIAVLNDHLCLFNIVEDIDGVTNAFHPQRFQWCSEASDARWTPASNNDAGFFDIIDTSDVGVGLYHLGNDLIAYKERSICPISFIGGNEVFGRRQSVTGVGLLGTYAMAVLSDRHVFMGQDSFYEYTGGVNADDSVGDMIRETVYTDLNPLLAHRSRALYMEETDEILFAYPSRDSTGAVDRCVVYNAKEGVWYGPFPIVLAMLGSSSRQLNGRPFDGFLDFTTNLFQFGLSETAGGNPVTRSLETGDQNIAMGATDKFGAGTAFPLGSVFQVTSLNLELTDLLADDIEVQIGSRMDLNDDITWSPVIYAKASFRQIPRLPVRSTGRWFRIRIVIPRSGRFELLGYQYEFSWVGTR